ncbi:MAG: hypothetical protein VX642_11820 [Bdellovibrionota bacterium]|nr:hypothetical protein [Bdellovibrionota bacterium]
MRLAIVIFFGLLSVLNLRAENLLLCVSNLQDKQGGSIVKAELQFKNRDFYYESY